MQKLTENTPADRIRMPSEARPLRVLRLDASASPAASDSRRIGDYLFDRLADNGATIELRRRDLNDDARFIDSAWIAANFTAAETRNAEQATRLDRSDTLIEELRWADHIVLTTPMYNFGVPATLKAWIDQVCRAGVTFRYTPDGPVGLLQNKRIDIVITTGGAPLGSPVDFVSGYLRQLFNFIGIEDVNIVGADRMNVDAETSMSRALAQIDTRFADSNEEVAA